MAIANRYCVKMRLYMLATVIAALFSFSAALAQDNFESSDEEKKKPVNRLCLPEDLTSHMYKLVDFHETPPKKEAMLVGEFPYHFLTFRPKNTYAMIAFNHEFKDPKKVEKYLNGLYSPQNFYTLDKDGVLTIVEKGKIKYVYRCVAVLRKYDVFMPGDLILTGYTKRRKSVIYKVYREWY